MPKVLMKTGIIPQNLPWLFLALFPLYACMPDINAKTEDTQLMMDSNKGLTIKLKLDRTEAYSGESVFFTAVVSHGFDAPVSVNTFHETNRSLRAAAFSPDMFRPV